MIKEKQTTTDAVEILHRLHIKEDPERIASLEAERIKAEIAQQIYDLRVSTELSQKQLAKKIGVTPALIDNLEMTDYDDHQLGDAILMLKHIAKAVGKQIEIQFLVSFLGNCLGMPMKREFRADDRKAHTGIESNRPKVLGLRPDLDL